MSCSISSVPNLIFVNVCSLKIYKYRQSAQAAYRPSFNKVSVKSARFKFNLLFGHGSDVANSYYGNIFLVSIVFCKKAWNKHFCTMTNLPICKHFFGYNSGDWIGEMVTSIWQIAREDGNIYGFISGMELPISKFDLKPF